MNAQATRQYSLHNHLLDALSTEARNRLRPCLELVHLPRGTIIQGNGISKRYVYFPTDAIVAKLAYSDTGACTEVSIVGHEGVIGAAHFMGGDVSSRQGHVVYAGHAYRLPGAVIKEEFDRHGELLALLLRHIQVLMTQAAQTAMCNRHHSIEQQFCRMLLQSLDRLPGNELIITQEIIANLLGVRRESITDAACRMKELELIECRRGRLRILDREGIEERCCECYTVVRNEIERLLPMTASTWRQQQRAQVAA